MYKPRLAARTASVPFGESDSDVTGSDKEKAPLVIFCFKYCE